MVITEIVEIMIWLENNLVITSQRIMGFFQLKKKAEIQSFSELQPFYFILLSYMWNISIKQIDCKLFIIFLIRCSTNFISIIVLNCAVGNNFFDIHSNFN